MTLPTFDRWLLGAGGLIALLVIAAGLTVQNVRRLNEDADRVTHTHEVIDTLVEVGGRLREAEDAQRTYLIVGGEDVPPEFTASLDATRQKVQRVKERTADNPEQQARLPLIEKQLDELAALWSHAMTVRKEQGFDNARRIVAKRQGRTMLAELLGQLRDMEDTERRLLQDRSRKRERTYHVALTTGLLSGLAAVAGVSAFLVLLRRHLNARTAAAAALAEQSERLQTTLARQRQTEEALKEADHRKDEFLATLAHELRNPLAPIRNALQIIRLTPEQPAREQARVMAERQLEQVVRLVDDLLDMSRISQGKLELRREQVELSAILTSAVETSRPGIDAMGHELTVTLPPEPILVHGDLTRLAQVFSNLLNNSAKYMDPGGRIQLSAERQGSDAVVSVKDTGIGIAADQLPHLFQMFTQVEHSLGRAQGGLGIGLTLVKRLIEMHDGSIDVKSEGVGKGAEFLVRLPIVVEAKQSRSAGDNGEPADLRSSLRILIVDDNRDSADSLAMLLRIMGNDTRTAYDGEQGLRAAEEFRPDVVLLDIGLPKLNGYEACRRIREQPWGKGLVLIAVTGWGQEDDRRRSHQAGFDHHIVKPVDPQEVMKLLFGLQKVKRGRS